MPDNYLVSNYTDRDQLENLVPKLVLPGIDLGASLSIAHGTLLGHGDRQLT